jgi:hypothetical protein
MVRFSGLLLIAAGAALLAQEQPLSPPPATAAPQAPPAVDQALRGRIQFFFQAHVDGKWRLADQVVAEDSKDSFFAMQKPRVLSYEIAKIEYSDNFQRAKVTVNCEEDMLMMGAGTVRLKMPRSSDWKLENGEWFWFFDSNAVRETPFGPLKYLANGAVDPSTPTQLSIPKGPSAKDIRSGIKLDKMEVSLKAKELSSDTVTVSNGLAGWVTLALQVPQIHGFEVKVDQKNVKAGQQAHITFRFDPSAGDAPPSEVVNLLVNPTGRLFAIRVTFQAPAPAAGKQPH